MMEEGKDVEESKDNHRGENMFPALGRHQPVIAPQPRPIADYISEDALNEIVHCDQCDEELIAMFKNDHVCDPDKLKNMVANQNGQLADPLVLQ